VLLEYVPTNQDTQHLTLAKKRNDYHEMVRKYFESLSEEENEKKIIKQIKDDVTRTLPNTELFRYNKIQEILFRLLYIWNIRHPASGYV